MTMAPFSLSAILLAFQIAAQSPSVPLTRRIEYHNPVWSPDGQAILFESTLDGKPSVYTIGADGNGLARLTVDTFSNTQPRWSPDGRRIVFSSDRAGHSELYVMNADGSEQVRLPTTAGGVYHQSSFSPDRRQFAFTSTAGGWSGLYVQTIGSASPRLIAGGPGAGPVGYLRTAMLTVQSDTMDTYVSPRGGAIQPGNGAWIVRSLEPAAGRRWQLTDTWHDSTGRVTAVQVTRTSPGSLATELESVRAPDDSASLLVTPGRVTGWVVPRGQAPRLLDGVLQEERYAGVIVTVAIAKSKSPVGKIFLVPTAGLYVPDPLQSRVDSVRVVRRDTLYRGAHALPVVVLERANGSQIWADEFTGATILSRGNAGPGRWWWHIRRGVRPPGAEE